MLELLLLLDHIRDARFASSIIIDKINLPLLVNRGKLILSYKVLNGFKIWFRINFLIKLILISLSGYLMIKKTNEIASKNSRQKSIV